MKANGRQIILMAIILAGVGFPSMSQAETYYEFYFGQAKTSSDDVEVKYVPFLWGRTETAKRRVSFDTSNEFGFRGIKWRDRDPWHGFAGDGSYFRASGDGAGIDVYTLTFLYMARKRLYADDKFENGRLQPYMGLGLMWVHAKGKVDFKPEVSHTVRESDDTIGPDLRLGLRWMLSPKVGIFTELRYTWASIDMEDDFLTEISAETDLETVHTLIGLSVRL